MEIISEINFPILKYIGTREIFAHKDFKPFFRKLDPNNLTRREKEETKDVDWSNEHVLLEIQPSPDTREKWPVLAVDRETYEQTGSETIFELDKQFNILWSELWHKQKPILITPELGDEIMDSNLPGILEWFDKKVDEGFTVSGMFLHTIGITELFFFHFDKENEDETTTVLITLYDKYIVDINIDQSNCLEGNPEALQDFGGDKEAYLNYKYYRIFKILHFLETYRMVPGTISKGETIKGTDIMYYADAPAVIYEKPIKN